MKLPNSDIETSALGIGCAYLAAGSLSGYDDRLIEAAFDNGARHFDVAPQYGIGTAECVLGRALKAKRSQVTIATKAGIKRPNVPNYKLRARAALGPLRKKLRAIKGPTAQQRMPGVQRDLDHSPAFILSSLDESLQQLGTDHVDIFALHAVPESAVTEELINALQQARTAGKARAIGLATDRETTKVILNAFPNVFDCVQYSWSVLDPKLTPSARDPFLITHRSLNRALIPISSWLKSSPDICAILADKVQADLSDDRVLAQALLGASLSANSSGISLVASRTIERTIANVKMSQEPETTLMGARLIEALSELNTLPKVAK
ncbi:aldo/keto reductase [Celeribacter halophilus]|uniref:aldo/keto reductase n=1 Tax=Celeribacter halophilus TaxID=576117 RepID=UPI003A957027